MGHYHSATMTPLLLLLPVGLLAEEVYSE